MSFNSNYLKLRQEREGSTTNNAGGATPPASSEEKPNNSGGNSYTSSYLALREKRNSMTISERAAARAQALQKKQQEYARTPAGILSGFGRSNNGPTTSGGYYSRPTLGSYSEKLYGNVTALEPILTEKRAALDTAQTSLLQAENDLKTVQGYLQQARAVYDADPTNENATSYNQIVGAYNLAYDSYASAFDAYSVAYDDYKPYEDQLIDALAIYQLYSNQQQAAFDDWRGTIRDAATIQTEITAIDQQMADLEVAEAAAAEAARQQQLAEYQAQQDAKPWYEKLAGYLGGVQDTTLPLAGVTPGTVEAAFNQPEKTPSREMQQLIAMKELLQEELNWSQYYYYADFAGAPDFAEMSKYVPQEEKEQRALDIMLDNYSSDAAPWEDPLYEYINGNEEAGAWLSNAGANYYGPDNAIGAFFGRATENKAESQQMTEQEVATFNYLYATQGKAAAHAYYDYLLADLNYRQRKSEEEYWAAEAAKNPVGTSVFSVVMSPAKGLSYIGQLTDYIGDGEIDQNAAYNKFVYTNNAIRGQVVKQIEESGKWGKVGSFAYQTGLSMADFLLASALTGNTQTVTLAIMGSGAAADTVMAAKDRGLNDDQAFTLGTIAGIAEAAMESVNMETVFNPNLLKEGVLKYILKNGAAEGMEEVGTDVVNLIADILISKDQSEWQISIDNYKKQGMTESEAIARALGDQALVMASDFAGGFVSGSILSGANAGIHVNYTNQMGNELGELDLDEEDIQAFIETGLESDPETASYQLAVEMQAKIEAGETLSNYDLARLYQANMQAIQAEEEDAEDLRDDTATDDQTDAVADDVTDPGGLSLPSVENDTQAPGFVTQNSQNGTQTQVNDTVLPDGVPLSIADQLRQEQAQNGGTQYERTYERAAGPATAQPAGELYLPGGAGISDGSAERNVGAGTAEQTGVLAGSAEQRRNAYADRSRATVARQNYARSLRLEKVSSLDLGLQNGTEARNIQVMPQENWDAEMSQLADRIYNETGKGVTYVMGRIQIRGTGGTVGYARGVITGDRIIVQADHLRIPMEQIADHEAYHAKVDFTDGRLNDEIRRHIVETFSEEQFRQVLDKYIVGLRGVIDVNETHTGAEFEAAVRQIEEEIFADAYAGINAFGAGADQFTGAVNEKMDQLYMGKIRNQDNGTEEPTGPPSDRYSFAGENANNADLDALARAKEMQAAGVADETIRQQTGWHTGMDGKWRWEIDDSGMQYTSRGDLGLRERRPEYARYRELLDKSNRYVLELSDEALTPEETAELQKLKEIWGGTFRKAGRITEDALPTELLSDYIKHDALFEAYPQLRKTRLRFADLPEGTRGQYDPEQDIITLSNKLRGKPQDTLIHEIQHVIQKAEGFAQGSSPEFWEQVQKGEQPVRVNDRRVAEAERRIQEILDSLPPFVAGQFELHRHLEKADPEMAMELADQLSEGPYGDEFSDFFLLTWDLDMAAGEDNYIRGAGDLYRNTAGEIEARDAASRRQLTVEQRRSAEPARADDRTVFVEDIDGAAIAELDAQYGPQLQSAAEFDQDTISSNIQQVAQMEPVKSISGQEFAKGEVDLITQVETFFNQRGNRAYSPELGEVILDRKGVKSDIAHGIGRKKAAAFAAVPDVIENGLVVDYQKDWKGRGYDTAVVAAPITIGAEDHIAAVILTRSNQTNRFYVHEVLTTKNGAMPFKTGTREGYPGGNTPSVFSILDRIRSVKDGKNSQERFSVDDSDNLSLQLGDRHSADDMDSHGRSLTPEQQAFFADSKVRDENGRLLPVYHGSKSSGFNVFQYSEKVQTGTDYGKAFYFTSDYEKASGYSYDAGKDPRIAEYRNNRNELMRRFLATHSEQDKNAFLNYRLNGMTARDMMDDEGYQTEGGEVKAVYLNITNPHVADANGEYYYKVYPDYFEAARKNGNDGIIVKNVIDNPRGTPRPIDVYIAFEQDQIKSTTNRRPTHNPDIRYSVDDVDSHGRSLTPEQQEFYAQSQARDSSGRLLVLYHQTDGDFTIFDTRHPGAGSRDSDTPFGIFLKQTAGDIGLAGKKQMALYANITNPLRAANREDLARQLREISGSYASISDKHKQLDAQYHEKFEQAKKAWRDYIIEWRAANPGANRSALNDDPKFNELFDAENAVVDEWTAAADLLSTQAKEAITEDLRKAGYDGVFLENDVGSWGRRTDAIIALDPQQVKNISNKMPTSNPDIRYSVDEGGKDPAQQQPAAPKKKIRPVAESRPLIAKKDLRNTVLNLFSIPNGQRAEIGSMIDSYADRLIKNGSLTEDDRKAFFDRMYDAGVMVMPADEYKQFARSNIVDGRIYVSDSVKADFGDDWADIRRRAFAAGVYLVNDRSASGIDQWNATLSAEDMLPGLFDSEETDERTILERILQVAEEGKDEHLSLAEYTRRLSQQEGISEDEFLDNMERQLDWALRTFAEKARLEVHLRDRTGRKIAQEREKGAERMTRQQAKEAQRRADERQDRKDSARRAKERRELRELQQRTLKQLQWLSKNRNRAPEELQATWDEVLGDIDLYAISAADEMRWSDKHNATWKDLAQMYKDAMKNDPNFLPSKELERIVTRLDATKIADMDLGALQDLYKAAIGLRTEFYNRNNVINDEMQRLFAEVYTDAKREIESAPGGFTGGVADKFLNLDQLTPMNVLQRMAGWDPDGAFYSMAKQLERGERDMRAYSVKAQKMLQDFLTEHEGWVKKADGQGKDAIWYEVEVPQLLELGMGDKPIFGPTVKVYMTPAQKVHMFLESKNLDNLRHMTGGRTFVNKDLYSQGKRQEALSQGRTIKLAPETVRKLVSDLTPEEMELAQILDRYYNAFATQEINKVSNILYGYDKAMGKNYAPIYTNRNYTKTEFGVFDTTAEGVGNLKGRQYAVNPSYNISAFDAFERHVDQTARFCGMAIPARNWTTLMNWREKNNSTGDVITHKWGEESKRYITDLITTLQAGDDAKSDTISSGLSKLQSNYITAIFGANPSIVLKQLGSIPLAGAYLDARNMPTPAQISKIDRSLISKYTQELEWRTMGYATPETKQLKDNPNWTQTNKAFKFVFGGGAITAMDGWAASTLWPWAENKVRREHPELAVGTKAQIDAGESAFYKKVAEEFEIAVSRSQSVSDEIHQGTLRKSKNPITKAFTMFRSDSAQTYNALRQKIGEARYYMRTGAKEKVVQTAKKAAGTAFVAMLLNAAWSEAVSFLMALWKNKGKYYRDDEDELTFLSVAGEMVSNMLGSYAGVVTGGEELFELIGNIITGDTWYGIETPGMEQLNDLLDTLIESGSGMRDLVAGGWDVLKNGGNLGDYFSKHSGEMLGGIKDLAKAAAMYLSGMPASNLEAYLTGAMKWISPELGAAYDDLFAETGKSDLAGMEGDALKGRVGRILSDRNVSESDDTAAALAALYEAGYKTAIPSDTPTSVSIDGEKHSLGDYQQQAYDTIWGGIVADALDDMVASDSFKEADPKTQAKMLSNLYTYAAEQAKAELFDEYELDSGAAKNAAIVAAGATVAECITWNTITSEMKSGEKSAELASWDIPEEAKREIFRCKISDSREDSIAAFDEAGLSFDQFLQAYSMYGQINNEDLKAGMKAVEFSHWVNAQGYTAEQAAVVKDELTYFNMTPASSSRYDELVGSGMDPDEAYDLTGALNELQPEDGADEVSDLQKWRASVDFSDDVEDQLAALSAVMTDAQFQKVEIANNFGVSPDAYVTLQEIKPQYDADGNGSYKNAEIKAAVDGLPGYYTTEQKAVLWQLATGSTSARNNPYSRQVGQQVLDARAAAKEAAAQEQTEAPTDSTDEDSFSQALLDQLLGRG